MNIDDLLSPYRGFNPAVDELVADVPAPVRRSQLSATPSDRGPELPSPDSWEMYKFVEALTA